MLLIFGSQSRELFEVDGAEEAGGEGLEGGGG